MREVVRAAEDPRPVLLICVMGRGRGLKGCSCSSDDIRRGRPRSDSCSISVDLLARLRRRDLPALAENKSHCQP